VARAAAGDAQTLKFFFEPGNKAYEQLIGTGFDCDCDRRYSD
jgi:hypothetical protein